MEGGAGPYRSGACREPPEKSEALHLRRCPPPVCAPRLTKTQYGMVPRRAAPATSTVATATRPRLRLRTGLRILESDWHRHDLVTEASCLDGGVSALVGAQSQLVLLLARHSIALGLRTPPSAPEAFRGDATHHILRGDTHGNHAVGGCNPKVSSKNTTKTR